MTAELNLPNAPFAMDVRATRGRRYPEAPHAYRNDYARDRDRVIHSRAFRRLEAKTQVFTTRYSDHFRTRLTHTLEVAQIARTIAGALGLNADLAEALAQTKLSDDEARAWHRDLKSARKTLKVPEDKWR